MDAADFQRKQRQLTADRVAGRISEAAYWRELDVLRRSADVETHRAGFRSGSSGEASTLWSPAADERGLNPGEQFDEY